MKKHTLPEMELMQIGVSLLENLLQVVNIFNHFLWEGGIYALRRKVKHLKYCNCNLGV